MALYAIGDVQGCFDSLMALLEAIEFDPRRDRIWLTGDLVNRGPKSLEVLRWAAAQGDAVSSVLGNHDLHFLARAASRGKKKKLDTLEPLLGAPDRDALVDWVRHRPLLHREGPRVFVHAGLLPSWSIEQAETLARGAEAALRADDFAATLARWDGPWPTWRDDLVGPTRIAAAVGVMVHLRMCTPDGGLEREFKGAPDEAPAGLTPWFRFPGRKTLALEVVTGHWAALGLHLADGVVAIDTACVWGDALTAVRLDDRAVFRQPALEPPVED